MILIYHEGSLMMVDPRNANPGRALGSLRAAQMLIATADANTHDRAHRHHCIVEALSRLTVEVSVTALLKELTEESLKMEVEALDTFPLLRGDPTIPDGPPVEEGEAATVTTQERPILSAE